MSSRKQNRGLLLLVLAGLLFILAACSSGGNDVTNAYNDALNQMQKGNNAKAAEILSRISFHEDSAQLAQYCSALALTDEGKYEEALYLFRLLDNYRDSRQCYDYYQAKRADVSANTPWYRAYAASLYDRDSIAGYKDATQRAEAIRSGLYQEGITAEETKKNEKGEEIEGSEDWATAYDCFNALGSYKDSAARAAYSSGRINEAGGNQQISAYVNAVMDFEKAGYYKDSTERLNYCLQKVYEKADQLIASGEFDEAEALYTALGNHCDESKKTALKQSRIAHAESMIEDGLYDEARTILLWLGETEKADYAWYRKAAALEEGKKYDEARKVYLALKDTEKADGVWYLKAAAFKEENKYDEAREVYLELKDTEKADEAWYLKATAFEEEKKYDEAREVYLELKDNIKADEAWYLKAVNLEEEGKTADAARVYMLVRDCQDSRERHYNLGVSVKESDPELAADILLADKLYMDAAEKLYEIADNASEESRYPLSIKVFHGLGNIRDCTLRMKNDLYLYGRTLMNNGQNDTASLVFDSLAGIGSADEYADMARYAAAGELEKNGYLDEAAAAFVAIKEYSDAAERAAKCLYASAQKKKAAGQLDDAIRLFLELGEYENSVEEEKDCRYLKAGLYESRSQWKDAIALYEELGNYAESAVKCTECRRQLGESLLTEGEASRAYQEFVTAGDKDGQARAAFMVAENMTADMNLKAGLEWYRLAAEYPGTEERTSVIAQMLLNMEEDDLSEQYASIIPNSENARKVFYALAIRSLERQDETAAMRLLQKAGDNADASERFREMLDNRVSILVSENKYEDAANLCVSFGDQEKADALLKQKAEKEEAEQKRITEENRAKHKGRIEEAEALLESGEYEAAAKIFTEIGETELAENALARKKAFEEEERAKAEEEEREKVKARIKEGDDLLAAGNYDGAIAVYRELGDQKLENEAIYQKAAGLDQPQLYLQIIDYKDSREKHYLAGVALLKSDPEKAYQILSEDLDYPGIQSDLYALADQESKAGNYMLSSTVFMMLSRQPLDPADPRPDCAMRAIQDIYQYGLAMKDKGEHELAAAIFEQVPGLSLAREHANESYYAIADSLEQNGKYAQAALSFETLGNYNDAVERAKHNRYEAAKSQMENGRYEEAEKGFTDLDDYEDAKGMVKQCRYLAAKAKMNAGKYEEAKTGFADLGEYEDAGTLWQECQYLIACGYLDNYEYEAALSAFRQLEGYKETAGKIIMCLEALGDQAARLAAEQLVTGDTTNAVNGYETAYEYYHFAGIREKEENAAVLVASCYQSRYNLNKAVEWYEKAGESGKTRILQIVQYELSTEQYESAEDLLARIDMPESRELFCEIAERQLALGETDEAIRLFTKAADYSDAKERHDELLYQKAEELESVGDYTAAAEIYENIKEYRDAAEKRYAVLYRYVEELVSQNEYQKAYDVFISLSEYLDAATRADELKSIFERLGNTILLGHYEQDNNLGNGSEPIEWIVLEYDETNHKLLLISKYGLDTVQYYNKFTAITWEQCTLRTWLNDEFLNKAFNTEEQSAILVTNVDNSFGQGYGSWRINGGKNTRDRIFLLSYAEANKYLGVTAGNENNIQSRVAPTAYAIAQGAWTSDSNQTVDGEPAGWWWLRSPGSSSLFAMGVRDDGLPGSNYVGSDDGVVRPAFWLNLEADIF